MKISIITKPGGWMKPGVVGAIALASGFWISQIIACNLVSGSMLNILPKPAGVAALAVFALFFAARMLRPGSRWPAILGLCSLGELMLLVSSSTRVNYGFQMQPAEMFVLLSLALGFAGIVLDVERCWRLIASARTHGQGPETTPNLDAGHHA